MNNYICPACQYLNIESILSFKNYFKCEACSVRSTLDDLSIKKLCSTFEKHNKFGYRCKDCERFIPHPLEFSKRIQCPYPNCIFIGEIDSVKRMRHPIIKSQQVVLESSGKINSSPILNAINELASYDSFTSVNCTVKQKEFIYQAYKNLLTRYPEEMSDYLKGERGNGLISKIFQEYISILEKQIPFSIRKKNKYLVIDSINHPKINPFSGIDHFSAIVERNGVIKNNTSQMYIGSRQSNCNKYYIGKLLDIINDNGESLLSQVMNYSFSQIKTNIAQDTKVKVSHLMIIPHYQVGILSHINRIKKRITLLLEKS